MSDPANKNAPVVPHASIPVAVMALTTINADNIAQAYCTLYIFFPILLTY